MAIKGPATFKTSNRDDQKIICPSHTMAKNLRSWRKKRNTSIKNYKTKMPTPEGRVIRITSEPHSKKH